MLLALKIDVDTLRGTREGVPNLVEMLRKHGVTATFLFSLGPDHTGRAIKRVFRPGFVGKVRRTSVVKHYGVKTLLYGTLLPGPDIGRRAADVMLGVRDAGHETGIHCWDHIRWQDGVAGADEKWTCDEMQRACERYTEIFKAPPAHARRRRLADEPACAAADAAAGVRLLLGRPRHASAPAGLERGADPLPAISDDVAHARRIDRHRRHHGGQRRRASARAHAGTCARRPCLHAACRTGRACGWRRPSSN